MEKARTRMHFPHVTVTRSVQDGMIAAQYSGQRGRTHRKGALARLAVVDGNSPRSFEMSPNRIEGHLGGEWWGMFPPSFVSLVVAFPRG